MAPLRSIPITCITLALFALPSLAEIEPGWFSGVQEQIALEEYDLSWQEKTQLPDLEASWQAPNRAHGFRTYFTASGIRVIPRSEAEPSWEWSLALLDAGKATLSASENRIEYRREGITEWYVNSSDGLKQGFTLDAPRPGIDLELGGTLSPITSSDGRSIDFLKPDRIAGLRYAGLMVFDATGRELPSRMEAFNEAGVRGIRLLFDDDGAVYPVTVDPLATSAGWIEDGDQAYAYFGVSVGTAGDVNGDGYSDIIVGAYNYDNGQSSEGRTFVYHGSASGPSSVADWTAEPDLANALFGFAVNTAGDVNGDGYSDVIVGAYNLTDGESSEGAAFVYHGSSGGLAATANWSGESNQAGASYGRSVATAGDVDGDGYSDIIVGAYQYDNGQSNEGRAWVYLGSATGVETSHDWMAEGDQSSAWFGRSVNTAGDVNGDGYSDVIVGGEGYNNGNTDEGRAWVFHGSSGGLSATADWTAESDQDAGYLGFSVSTAGDVNGDGFADVIVGAYRYDTPLTDAGVAYVYHGSGSGLSATPDWTGDSGQENARFGCHVSTAGDVNGDGYADVIVGAYRYDNGETDEGMVFAYLGSPSGLATAAFWTAESDQGTSEFGRALGTAGDVNGDGYSDIIVGAFHYDDDQTDEGRAWVYNGSAGGLSATAGWTAEQDQASARFGHSVAAAGDVDGDGYADVIVGAPLFDNGQANEGAAFVYHGSATGLEPSHSWTAESDQADASFGSAVATAGDVNGDGYADVIIGAVTIEYGVSDDGKAFVYHGSATGLSTSPDWTAECDVADASFGRSVATAGDVNGDGYADVIVGANTYDNPELWEGAAFVYHGSGAGLSTSPDWMAESNQAGAEFGFAVSTAGDGVGDGYSGVVIGAPEYDQYGAAFIAPGSAAGLSNSLERLNVDLSTVQFADIGYAVGTAGDINGDGLSDIIVGAPSYSDASIPFSGAVFIYHSGWGNSLPSATIRGLEHTYLGRSVGTAGDINGDGRADTLIGSTNEAYAYTGLPRWTAQSGQGDAPFRAMGAAGDVNGDGYADVIIGAPYYENGQSDEGRAFVYYGNEGKGLSLTPEQRRYGSPEPIAPLGMSDDRHGFRLALTGRTPYGRGRAKLEWEVKPLGTPFTGIGTSSSSAWMDTGTGGSAINEIVSGLAPGSDYHWRVRLLYDPVTFPYQQNSRWLTVPWNGWQEKDVTTFSESDAIITMTDSPDPALVGRDVTYAIGVVNNGPDPDALFIVDELPPGVTFVAATPSQGSCSDLGGSVECALGTVSSGGSASVTLVVTPNEASVIANQATVHIRRRDPDTTNNRQLESTTVRLVSIGDIVWDDQDGDGIQDAGEPGMGGVTVSLYDGTGAPVTAHITDALGEYLLTGMEYGQDYYVRFMPPEGYVLTLQNQGGDDFLDSDADPLTWKTPIFSLLDGYDPIRWDAGMIPNCVVPDETVYISGMTTTDDGNNYPVIHFQDPNQPSQTTGYNIYRSSVAATPPGEWPLVASDIVDMDEGEPDKQWVDSSGEVSPTGVWHAQVTAFNSRCPVEGPR